MPPFLTAADVFGLGGKSLGAADDCAGGLEDGLTAADGEDPAEGAGPSPGESGLALVAEPGVTMDAAG